jgi:hypothetical protein
MVKSDHRPIIVNTSGVIGQFPGRERPRRFEARWLKQDGPKLMTKVNVVHKDMHVWDREVLKKPAQHMKKLKRELEILRCGSLTDESIAAQKEILLRLELLLEQEEIIWVQRARANWLKHGDRDTSFFYQHALARRKRNLVKGLVDDRGLRHEDIGEMNVVVRDYFTNLFTSEVYEVDHKVLEDVNCRVTSDMNQILLAPFSREEAKKALFSIGDLKAASPDGLHAIFFKRFWNMLGDELIDEVLHAVNNATIPEGWNDTTIVMIPKVDNPDRVAQFRPISLCNVVYKVIPKVLSSRLKVILPDIISHHQSAFVLGRLITDNILLAYECIHTMKKKKGKRKLCAVKLDMHKAYDRVEWIFLEKIMIKLGFDQIWTKLIMACVRSVKYKVRLNSVETDTIIPTRGQWQG